MDEQIRSQAAKKVRALRKGAKHPAVFVIDGSARGFTGGLSVEVLTRDALLKRYEVDAGVDSPAFAATARAIRAVDKRAVPVVRMDVQRDGGACVTVDAVAPEDFDREPGEVEYHLSVADVARLALETARHEPDPQRSKCRALLCEWLKVPSWDRVEALAKELGDQHVVDCARAAMLARHAKGQNMFLHQVRE